MQEIDTACQSFSCGRSLFPVVLVTCQLGVGHLAIIVKMITNNQESAHFYAAG
jgi:hypothetical protein